MKRTITAILQDKKIVATAIGQRVHLTFQTIDGRNVIIRAPIEDTYLANIDLQAQVYFWRDTRGCHHLDRQRVSFTAFWQSLFPGKHFNSTEPTP
jgi:hypothetical protein